VGTLLDGERARYLDLLDSLELEDDSAEHLRDAAHRVDDLRFAGRQAADDQHTDGHVR